MSTRATSSGPLGILPHISSIWGHSEPAPISAGGQDEFLCRRIARFGLLAAAVSAVILLYRVAVVTLGEAGPVASLHLSLHALATAILLAVWGHFRSGSYPYGHARVVEALALFAAAVGIVGTILVNPDAVRPELSLVLFLGLGLIARSVLVPSTTLQTGLIALAAGIPLVLGLLFLPLRIAADSEPVSGSRVWEVALWWLVIAVLASVTSRVIYGLRLEIDRGKRLGKYLLEEPIGSGGMGVVYRASHAMLKRPTALKLLPPERSGKLQMERFRREVQLTARLSHPNIVTVYDYGRTPGGLLYYVMELIEGCTVQELVDETGPMPSERVAHLMHQAASALEEAHSIGLIHRDIKPSNLMLCANEVAADRVKIVDFGLVKSEGDGSEAGDDDGDSEEVRGTPHYLAPESITNPDGVGHKIDVYALGAVGYFALCQRNVFAGDTIVELCSKHIHESPVAPSELFELDVDPDLEAIVLACLRKNPHERPDASEVRRVTAALRRGWSSERARQWWQEHRARFFDAAEDEATSEAA